MGFKKRNNKEQKKFKNQQEEYEYIEHEMDDDILLHDNVNKVAKQLNHNELSQHDYIADLSLDGDADDDIPLYDDSYVTLQQNDETNWKQMQQEQISLIANEVQKKIELQKIQSASVVYDEHGAEKHNPTEEKIRRAKQEEERYDQLLNSVQAQNLIKTVDQLHIDASHSKLEDQKQQKQQNQNQQGQNQNQQKQQGQNQKQQNQQDNKQQGQRQQDRRLQNQNLMQQNSKNHMQHGNIQQVQGQQASVQQDQNGQEQNQQNQDRLDANQQNLNQQNLNQQNLANSLEEDIQDEKKKKHERHSFLSNRHLFRKSEPKNHSIEEQPQSSGLEQTKTDHVDINSLESESHADQGLHNWNQYAHLPQEDHEIDSQIQYTNRSQDQYRGVSHNQHANVSQDQYTNVTYDQHANVSQDQYTNVTYDQHANVSQNQYRNHMQNDSSIGTIQYESNVMEKVDINLFRKEDIRKYIVSQCEVMKESTVRVDQSMEEYSDVTEYFTDVQKIEQAPEQMKNQIAVLAKRVNDLSVDRRISKVTENKLSTSAYRRMEQMESEIPRGYQYLKKQEAYHETVSRDMKMLEAEQLNYRLEGRMLTTRQLKIRSMSIAAIIGLVLAFLVFIIALSFVDDDEYFIFYIIVAFLGAVIALGLFALQKYTERQVLVTEIKLNKATNLLNKTKIKFINAANTLDYEYSKYHVKSSFELEKKYQAYIEMKEDQKKALSMTSILNDAEEQLEVQLAKLDLFDTHIWLTQIRALYDPRDMVEVRHDLSIRRQKLRNLIEYNEQRVEEAKANIKNITVKHPEYTQFALGIINEYGENKLK